MKLKLASWVTGISAAVLSTALVATVASAGAGGCAFSKLRGADTASSNGPTDPTSTTVDSSSSLSTIISSSVADSTSGDWMKLAIAGVGLTAAGGLIGGGLWLKNRLAAKSQPGELATIELPDLETFETSDFAIVIPPEAMASLKTEDAAESELTASKS